MRACTTVVCARYRDPVIRPSMDSMIFRNGKKKKKKDQWTQPDSNDHTVGPCAFFFQRDTMPWDSTIVRNKVVCDRARSRALNASRSVSFYSFSVCFFFDLISLNSKKRILSTTILSNIIKLKLFSIQLQTDLQISISFFSSNFQHDFVIFRIPYPHGRIPISHRFRDDCKSARKSHIPRSRRPWRYTSLVLSFVQPTNELIIQKGTRYWFPCSENLQTGDLRHIAGDWLLDYWSYRQLMRWLPI